MVVYDYRFDCFDAARRRDGSEAWKITWVLVLDSLPGRAVGALGPPFAWRSKALCGNKLAIGRMSVRSHGDMSGGRCNAGWGL